MSRANEPLQQTGTCMKPALWRGACGKCPRCANGRLFSSYLKVAPECDACGLDLTPQRADDGPAYVVVFVVAHLIGVLLPLMFMWFGDRPALIAVLLSAATVALSLFLLPPIKGMFVSLQWVKGMHGFRVPALVSGD